MKEKISLAKYWENKKEINITVEDYYKMTQRKDKPAISNMIYHRFYERYVKPFEYNTPEYKKYYKNGFAMMASGCLLIEVLESFYKGWETTLDKGEKTFNSFFHKSKSLKQFEGIGFYKYIRCGILHQAETTGGFKISRKGALFDKNQKKINADKFHGELKNSLQEYIDKLKNAEWDGEIWDNLRRKMRFIIKHCENK
jgi:hypothetical protein